MGPGALAVPQTTRPPRVERPGQKSDRAAEFSVFCRVGYCHQRSGEIMQIVRELRDYDGLSWQEIDEIVAREVEEKYKPEIAAELQKVKEEEEERLRLIRDPKTRDSVVPRDSLEKSVMRGEIAESENDALRKRVAALNQEADRLEAEARGEKKTTLPAGSARTFFSEIAAAFAAFFCFIGWKLGLCSRPGEKKEGAQ
ncbi:MAG: hypothetical protein LBF24_01985 [Puniceicoccales bacterium]|nr:hypothetical protein [Puniceicoccales bacterium]